MRRHYWVQAGRRLAGAGRGVASHACARLRVRVRDAEPGLAEGARVGQGKGVASVGKGLPDWDWRRGGRERSGRRRIFARVLFAGHSLDGVDTSQSGRDDKGMCFTVRLIGIDGGRIAVGP